MSNDPSEIPVQPAPLGYDLPNLAQHLSGAAPVRIVALGSSTTAGRGDVVAYPYRLEALLRVQHQSPMIDVLNRGISGQEAPDEFDRLERDVIAENPCLVIWQFGTNSVWQSPAGHPPSLSDTIAAVKKGIIRLRQVGTTDIILMDVQYAPAMLTPAKIDATHAMASAIGKLAGELDVNLFRRFDMMKAWYEVEQISFDQIVDPKDDARLHDSDWTTRRMAGALNLVISNVIAKGQVPAPACSSTDHKAS
jgi:lysophospholipase L1-like esterase